MEDGMDGLGIHASIKAIKKQIFKWELRQMKEELINALAQTLHQNWPDMPIYRCEREEEGEGQRFYLYCEKIQRQGLANGRAKYTYTVRVSWLGEDGNGDEGMEKLCSILEQTVIAGFRLRQQEVSRQRKRMDWCGVWTAIGWQQEEQGEIMTTLEEKKG